MTTKILTTFAAATAVLLTFLGPETTRAGTITIVNLPATNTDFASVITTNNYYVCAFDFGNSNTNTYSVNGVPFTHFDPGNQTVNLTNVVDPNFGGQVILSSGGTAACKLARTSNSGQGSLSTQSDGNMFNLLTDLMYVGSSAPLGSWLQQEYDNLTPGHPYSLRIYYRYWGNTVGDRTQNVFFNGEGTWEAYPSNPLDEDAGGAHYIKYDFTASATNVFCLMSNLVANGSMMVYGATLEDDSFLVVTLPATNTDLATGITTNKHYVCAFDFGNNGTTPTINDVSFTHFDPGNSTVNVAKVIDPNFGGQLILSSGGPTAPGSQLTRTSNSGQGSLSSQADGNMFTLLTDLIYIAGGAQTGRWLQQEYDNLTPGHPYSLRLYYRYWGNTLGDRQQNVFFNGEGTWQAYPRNPWSIDAGGARYIKYDFIASATNVFCLMTNLVAGSPGMIYGATLEDDSYPFAPFITYEPSSTAVNGGSSSVFNVTAIGTAPLAYQWYFSTNSDSSGAMAVTNTGGRITGAAAATLTITNEGNADGGYYFVVVTNASGAITSSVANLTVVSTPSFVLQPIATNLLLYAGPNHQLTLQVAAVGAQPEALNWFTNGVADLSPAGTNSALISGQRVSSYTNAPLTATNFFCVASNYAGMATSAVVTVTILPDPTAAYPSNVLADKPIGFWRLNEAGVNGAGGGPNNGVIANDYWGGNCGIYTNTTLVNPGYNTTHEPAETSAGFEVGGFSSTGNDVNSINGIDFSATNTGVAFTVEAWVNGPISQIGSAPGICAKGVFNNEEFTMDTGSPVNKVECYRFEIRGADGTGYNANSAYPANDGIWHHLVGVCDEPHGVVSLYIDGRLAGSTPVATNAGVMASNANVPMTIGARASSVTSGNDQQFFGYIADVAIYNYALSSNQAQAHFYAGDQAPTFIQQPPSFVNANANGTLVITAVANGAPPLSYQWAFSSGIPIAGQTNATLEISNLDYNTYNGANLYVTVTNAYGTTNSSFANVNVYSGAPFISTDVQPIYLVLSGDTVSLSVTANGTEPFSSQWQVSDTNGVNWTNLTDNGRISGSHSTVLTIANAQASDAGDYRLAITNTVGGPTPTRSSTAELLVTTLPIGFNGAGFGWTANQFGNFTVPIINSGLVTLTDGAGNEARSFFFNDPQYIGAFKASFTYRAGGSKAADGGSFCLQNDLRGAAALGGVGGALGVMTGVGGTSIPQSITPSAELEWNMYQGVGYALETGGFVPAGSGFTTPGSVNLISGDPINVSIYYAYNRMSITFTDAVAVTSYSTNWNVNLAQVLGANTAYIGFTGADGGSTSIQTISNFTFVNIPSAAIQINNGTNAVLSWPGAVSGFVLQQNGDLNTTNWSNVANPANLVNGQYQIIVPLGSTNLFYRLILPSTP
ncbi:MAG TPA: LamG-like jellyroll fold domain-containing protein [Candidatus Saccharimonadales bacterium]|nr:LamG-like jellyroll fold domain-containing protein [Candidatus Saccharimonadales bacterium]